MNLSRISTKLRVQTLLPLATVAFVFLGAPLLLCSADETAPRGQWLSSASEVQVNKPITVWLAVQPVMAATSVSITVVTPTNGSISVSQSGTATCTATSDKKVTCTAKPTDPLLLEFSVTPSTAGVLRTVALVEYARANAAPLGYAILSDKIRVRGLLEVGPAVLPIASAIFGLIAGVLTQWFASWRQQKQDDRKRRLDEQLAARKLQQEGENALIKSLSVEMVKNHDLLQGYIEHSGPPPTLATGGYNTVVNTALGYLDTATRSVYLQKLDGLYGSIKEYNSKVTQGANPTEIRAAAQLLLEALTNGLKG